MGIKDRLLIYIASKGMNIREFERAAGLSNGYIKNMKQNITSGKLEQILLAFPTLSREWLLAGDGDMCKSIHNSNCGGDNSINFNGSGNSVSTGDPSMRDLLNETLALLRKRDEQFERLLAILEKMCN